jgi:glycosyltransferase involved in cell wall biosynthesis
MTEVKRVFITAPLMPEFDREGGSQRVLDLIMLFRQADWAVTFLAQNALPETKRYANILQQMGVMVYAGPSSSWAGDAYLFDVSSVIAHGKFDLAIFIFWYSAEIYLPAFRHLSPNTRLVIDSVDLHFLRVARAKFSNTSAIQQENELDAIYADEMRRELNMYAAADGVLAVSEKEADLINNFVSRPDHAYTVPLMEKLAPSNVDFENRNGILFIGNLRHTPNQQALEFLCEKIMPLISQASQAQHPLYLVGNGLSHNSFTYRKDLPNVRIVGWVPSLIPYLQKARITVVPLLNGAGTKTKLIQALTVGTPTVTTNIGAEGLNLTDHQEVLIADNPEDFAQSMETLLVDKELWQQLSTKGRQHIRITHSPEAVANYLWTAVEAVLAKAC